MLKSNALIVAVQVVPRVANSRHVRGRRAPARRGNVDARRWCGQPLGVVDSRGSRHAKARVGAIRSPIRHPRSRSIN